MADRPPATRRRCGGRGRRGRHDRSGQRRRCAGRRAGGRRTRARNRRTPRSSSCRCAPRSAPGRSEEHTSELQSCFDLVCRLLLEKKKITGKWLRDAEERGEEAGERFVVILIERGGGWEWDICKCKKRY